MVRDILDLLRVDAGTLTFGQLIQHRELAAHEIKRLRNACVELSLNHVKPREAPRTAARVQEASRQGSLLRLREVCQELSLSRSTIYARMQRGEFPRPVLLGPRSVRWTREARDQWRVTLLTD